MLVPSRGTSPFIICGRPFTMILTWEVAVVSIFRLQFIFVSIDLQVKFMP